MGLYPGKLGRRYVEMGKDEQAELLFQRALDIKEKALGPNHISVAVSLSNLAEIYIHKEQYTKAESLLKRSVTIFEKSLGMSHPDLATVIENYALLLRAMNRNEEAA